MALDPTPPSCDRVRPRGEPPPVAVADGRTFGIVPVILAVGPGTRVEPNMDTDGQCVLSTSWEVVPNEKREGAQRPPSQIPD